MLVNSSNKEWLQALRLRVISCLVLWSSPQSNSHNKGNIVLRACRALQVCTSFLYFSFGCASSHIFLSILLVFCCVLFCSARKNGIRRCFVFFGYFVGLICELCAFYEKKGQKQHIAPIHTTHTYIYIYICTYMYMYMYMYTLVSGRAGTCVSA